MFDILVKIYSLLGVAFCIVYAYQALYILIPFIIKPKKNKKPAVLRRIGVLVCARNEAIVIKQLLKSIADQDYPAELLSVFVCADNCEDNTAQVARDCGAVVYERFNTDLVGKGYAMQYLIEKIEADYADDPFDAYMVFDADNIIEPDYISKINETYSQGYNIVTGYRNAKNFGDNWITAGQALTFIRESKYLQYSRMLLGTGCSVGGTGFMFNREISRKLGGWGCYCVTEDLEFTAKNVIDGEKIGYCNDAILYDEQPTGFRQSWRQRMRWSKGILQVLRRNGGGLLKGVFSKNGTTCADIFLILFPSLYAMIGFVEVSAILLTGLITHHDVTQFLFDFAWALGSSYVGLLGYGLLTTITEWKRIHTTPLKKILYLFTFPIHVFTYVPLTIQAYFVKPQWKPIHHMKAFSVDDMQVNDKDPVAKEKELSVK